MQIPFRSENQAAGGLAGPADGADAGTVVHVGSGTRWTPTESFDTIRTGNQCSDVHRLG